METVNRFLEAFLAFNANGVYAIGYFLKNNFFFIFVLISIGYMTFQEFKAKNAEYVDDERRII